MSSAVSTSVAKTGGDGETQETWTQRVFRRTVVLAVRMPLVVIALAGAVAGLGFIVFQELPRELTPSEDRGVVFVPLSAPQGSTVSFTDQAARQVERISEPLVASGDVETVFTYTGSWGRPHRAFVVLRLTDWENRERSHRDIVRAMIPNMSEITAARGFPITPAGLGLRGSRTPLRIVVSGPDFESVKEWAGLLLARAVVDDARRISLRAHILGHRRLFRRGFSVHRHWLHRWRQYD